MIINANIPTEEPLNDAQIIEIVLAEQLEDKQDNPNDSDEKLCNILPLNVFQKYLPLMEKKNAEAKKQKSITDFFGSLEIQETTSNN
ncbi:12102_t:CDS:2 [Ambispora leptoticha]|uniref:12102_t:CDS:1 n=1 Tax=Ambispora leptoticha TaxID=144679 RepID=A0A9N9AE63_9GLOM|nr:12102_t:CDS:2 [Ambispora leptoticha]